MFRLRGEVLRIEIADALIQHKYKAAGLGAGYAEALGAIHWCKNVRNQYAHAQWRALDPITGLQFYDLQMPAKTATGSTAPVSAVDVPLLTEQERYFCYTSDWLNFLSHEYRLKMGKIASHAWTAPQIIPQPRKYNPPGRFVLPKLPTTSTPPPTAPPRVSG